MKLERIGLYGGSFDPVHTGHLLVARAALEEAGLDRLFLIPAAVSPFKPNVVPTAARDRLRLLRLALAGETQCEVDEGEIRRGGISYTINTARDYAKRFPGAVLLWLIGADHVAQLPAWKDSTELARRMEFLVIPRPGEPAPHLPAPFRGTVLNGFPFAVSSTGIRERVRSGRPITQLVPPAVAEAIRNNRLYL